MMMRSSCLTSPATIPNAVRISLAIVVIGYDGLNLSTVIRALIFVFYFSSNHETRTLEVRTQGPLDHEAVE